MQCEKQYYQADFMLDILTKNNTSIAKAAPIISNNDIYIKIQKLFSVIHTGFFQLFLPICPELVQPVDTLVLQVAFGVFF